MSQRSLDRPVMPRFGVAAAAVVMALVLGACGGAAPPTTSFDPASACTSNGRMPGAYPDLEALLPKAYEGTPPTTVDSGRNCTKDSLGTLADHGIDGVRFAGATWPLGGTTGLTVAVFEGDGLDAGEVRDFYAAGARAASHTDELTTSDTTVGGQPATRLDVRSTDGTGQTVVAWPGDAPGRVMVLLASDLGDAKVLEALDAVAGH
jgi:hypothetical protein